MLAAASAQAAQPLRPAEEPPADFAGRQFIDSSGCVFLREGKLWVARLGRDGGPVCGYPPTPLRGAAAAAPPDEAPALDGMGRIESELVTALASGLRPGDLVGPPPTARADEAQAAGETDLAGVMAAAVAASPAVARASAVAGTRDNARLCGLLGIGPGAPAPALGGDPTGGFCGGGGVAQVPRVAQAEAAARQAAAGAAVPGRAATPRARPATHAGGKTATTKRVVAPPAPRTDGHAWAAPARLIPAGTRFLRIGTYPDAASAQAALRQIAGLGLPVARSRPGAAPQAVLAGPFGSRQAVVRAHDRLTRAGFTGLVPMR